MTDEDWHWSITKKHWESHDELPIEIPERVKDVKTVASLLRNFLEEEKLPFKILGKIEIFYSDKRADSNLNEIWNEAFVMIPILKRGILHKPNYDKLEGKHFLKVRISFGASKITTWQEYRWQYTHRWFMEMEQIKAWKVVLEKFGKTLPSLKGKSEIEIGNPSAR